MPTDPFAAIAKPLPQADPFAAIATPLSKMPPAQPSVWQVLTQPTEKTDAEYLGYTGAAGVAGATVHGISNVAEGTLGALKGTLDMLTAPPQGTDEHIAEALGPVGLPLHRALKALGHSGADATQIVGAIHDINQSPDPLGHYAQAAEDTAGQGAGQALVALAGEGVVRGLPATASAVENAIPSTARAGAALQEVKAVAGDVPIPTADVGDTALSLYEQSQRGATLPKAVRDLVNRMTKPDAEPLTYAEAKDFQSNISRLSANEKMSLNANTKRLVGQLNGNLKSALEDAADVAGKGQQFTDAMREYHRAMQLRGFTDAVKAEAWKYALGAAGVYGAAKIFGVANAPGQSGQ